MKNLNMFLCSLLSLFGGSSYAADYYCDPATGSMANPGTSTSPWSTLEAVFTANKTFVAGDVINLRTGYHGDVTIKGTNSGDVTIQAQSGNTPAVRRIWAWGPAAHWVISGVTISPEAAGVIDPGKYISFRSGSSYMTVKNCLIYSASSISGWTATDWTNKAGMAVFSQANHTVLLNNTLRNISGGIGLDQNASYSQVTGNTIENFCGDAIAESADDTIFDYNTILNCFNNGGTNHRDGFQSYSIGYDPVSGKYLPGWGTVKNVTLRGNIFISQTDPNQPLHTEDGNSMHGIGCFDGLYDNWVIENNLIVSGANLGIALYGARNCRIMNNTVILNPLKPSNPAPGIVITYHKYSEGPDSGVPSSNDTIRNNLAAQIAVDASTVTTTSDHNIATTAYTGYFVNYAGFDYHLASGSPAIDAGSATLASTIDLDEEARPQGGGFDIGAYEYGGLPSPWVSQDIGAVGFVGSASVSGGTWTVKGGGANIWSTADAFRYVYQAASGDCSVTARVATQQNTGTYAIAGVMIRSDLTAGSANAMAYSTPLGSVFLQYRTAAGGATANTSVAGTAPNWVRIMRTGNTFTAYSSPNGTTWTQVGPSQTITMGTNVYIGLAVCPHNNAVLATDTFDNVTATP